MSAIKTIIISRTDKIGDFVVSIPSFATAKAMYPEAKVIALVSKNNWMIAKNLKCIDECICVDHFKSEQEIAPYLAQYNPDVFIALVSDNKISKLAKDCGASTRIGPFSKLFSFFHYNKGVRQRRSLCLKSEAEYNLDLVRSLNQPRFDEVGVHFDRIVYTQREKASIVSYFHQNGISEQDFILLNPFTGGSGSNLSQAGYAQVIEGLLDENNIRRLGFGGDDKATFKLPNIVIMGIEPNREGCNNIIQMVPAHLREHIYSFINTDSLLVAAAMVDSCKVFIGPSTGITQIAGNYHKSAVCFYSTRKSNSHTRWALYGDPNEYPVTLDLEHLDPATKELKVLTDDIKEQILSPVLRDFYQK